jgi:Flavodoxin domain
MYIDPGSGGCWPRRRASLVDKGKPDVSRGRKATGPTRSAGLPDRKNASCASSPNSSALSPRPAIEMSILVAYTSRHGATGEIAKRIAQCLRARGHHADARPVLDAGDLADCEGFVIGGAADSRHWLKDATAFVRRNRGPLDDHKVADDVGAKGKNTLNGMKVQRNPARDEPRAFKAPGPRPEQSTSVTGKPEGDIDAIKAAVTREASMSAGVRSHVTCAGGLLHLSESRMATR